MCLAITVLFGIFLPSELACYITICIMGFFMVPILFVAYELAVEQACTPETGLGEATPVGVINMLANTLGAIEIFALTPVLADE